MKNLMISIMVIWLAACGDTSSTSAAKDTGTDTTTDSATEREITLTPGTDDIEDSSEIDSDSDTLATVFDTNSDTSVTTEDEHVNHIDEMFEENGKTFLEVKGACPLVEDTVPKVLCEIDGAISTIYRNTAADQFEDSCYITYSVTESTKDSCEKLYLAQEYEAAECPDTKDCYKACDMQWAKDLTPTGILCDQQPGTEVDYTSYFLYEPVYICGGGTSATYDWDHVSFVRQDIDDGAGTIVEYCGQNIPWENDYEPLCIDGADHVKDGAHMDDATCI